MIKCKPLEGINTNTYLQNLFLLLLKHRINMTLDRFSWEEQEYAFIKMSVLIWIFIAFIAIPCWFTSTMTRVINCCSLCLDYSLFTPLTPRPKNSWLFFSDKGRDKAGFLLIKLDYIGSRSFLMFTFCISINAWLASNLIARNQMESSYVLFLFLLIVSEDDIC